MSGRPIEFKRQERLRRPLSVRQLVQVPRLEGAALPGMSRVEQPAAEDFPGNILALDMLLCDLKAGSHEQMCWPKQLRTQGTHPVERERSRNGGHRGDTKTDHADS